MSHASHIVHCIFVNGQLFANRTDPMFIMILSWNVDTFMLPLNSSYTFLKHLHFQLLAILQSIARPTHGERAHVLTTYQAVVGMRTADRVGVMVKVMVYCITAWQHFPAGVMLRRPPSHGFYSHCRSSDARYLLLITPQHSIHCIHSIQAVRPFALSRSIRFTPAEESWLLTLFPPHSPRNACVLS